MSRLSRKWKRSSFDSVAGNIRTPTLTRPKEIVPLQIDRMRRLYPERPAAERRVQVMFAIQEPWYYGFKHIGRTQRGFPTKAGGSQGEVGRGAGLAAFMASARFTTCSRAGEKAVGSVDCPEEARSRRSGVDAERPEPRPPPAPHLVRRHALERAIAPPCPCCSAATPG